MKNSGVEFELLVRSIFQEIASQEFVKTVSVQHNVDLTGKSGAKHQIDVFWEFEVGGIKYATIIQVKDWESPIKQGQVLLFKSVLDDIPGQPRGYIVTKSSFQRGAKNVAGHHGIVLFELKEAAKPDPIRVQAHGFADIKANLEEWCFEVQTYDTKYLAVKALYSNAWLEKQDQKEQIKTAIQESRDNDIWKTKLFDEKAMEIGTIAKAMGDETIKIRSRIQSVLKDETVFREDFNVSFNNPTFMTFSGVNNSVRLDSISFTTEITKNDLIKRPFLRPGITTFVLKDVLGKNSKEFSVKQVD